MIGIKKGLWENRSWYEQFKLLRSQKTSFRWGKAEINGIMGWIVSPHHSYVEVLTPSTSECDHIWGQDLYRGNWAEMRSLGQALIKYDWRPRKKRKCGHRHAQMEGDVRAQGEGGDLHTKGRGLRRNQTCWHLDLGSSLELWETKYLSSTQSAVLCYGSASNLIQVEWGRARGAPGKRKLRGNKM